jgi:hypothetical protein
VAIPSPTTSIDDESSRRVSEARSEALAWLRRPRNPPLPADGGVPMSDGQIIECCLGAILGAGFEFTVVNLGTDGSPAFEVRWGHQGFSFVGFKQAPTAPTLDEAKLLACAALLRNDWCRGRLPQ